MNITRTTKISINWDAEVDDFYCLSFIAEIKTNAQTFGTN